MKMLDSDGDGFVSLKEAKAFLDERGITGSSRKRMIKEFKADAGEDGKVSVEELQASMDRK